MLMRNYELFSMKDIEPIQEMVTSFTIIINESSHTEMNQVTRKDIYL